MAYVPPPARPVVAIKIAFLLIRLDCDMWPSVRNDFDQSGPNEYRAESSINIHPFFPVTRSADSDARPRSDKKKLGFTSVALFYSKLIAEN